MKQSSKVIAAESMSCQQWHLPIMTGSAQHFIKASDYTDELNQIKIQTEKQAYEAGMQRGMQEAEQETLRQRQLLQSAIELLDAPINRIDDQVESLIISLVQTFTQKLLSHEVTTNPELLVTILKQVVELLPKNNEKVSVSAHPDDIALLEQAIKEGSVNTQNCEFIPNEKLHRGELKVATAQTSIEAIVAKQIENVIERSLQEG